MWVFHMLNIVNVFITFNSLIVNVFITFEIFINYYTQHLQVIRAILKTTLMYPYLITYKPMKKTQHLHCPHRNPLAYSQTLYKHTGHTLKIFSNSSDMANKIEKKVIKM